MTAKPSLNALIVLVAVSSTLTCRPAEVTEPSPDDFASASIADDPHSYSRPTEVVVRHLELDLAVDFEHKILEGTAVLTIEKQSGAQELVLDTRDLEIHGVLLDDGTPADFSLGEDTSFMGQSLTIALTDQTEAVIISYATDPSAEALQWLGAEQTGSGKPFLFSQSQAILARNWVPCQDTPEVRITYDAIIKVPTGLMAVMSAENGSELQPDGIYRFHMGQPIPSYLLALAVGDLAFRSLGNRSGVYAEPEVVDKAAWEFADVEEMMVAAERLYGPYRWDRFDLLVLPPSFPFGGMENPRLTFATPTILAGDRSLVALVAHELAHSWSGNLVTNATWSDFWLNEGFTSYIENRIMEELYGVGYARMLASLGRQELEKAIEDAGPADPDTHLSIDLADRHPDDGITAIAYDKGAAFLATMESLAGRPAWDEFLRRYFETYSFRSLDTATFVAYLRANLLDADPELAERAAVDQWIYGPGLPGNAVEVHSNAFARVETQAALWREGKPATDLDTEGWTTHHWLHFVRNLPDGLGSKQMAELDSAFGLSDSGNSEILCSWLTVAVQNDYKQAYTALEQFLTKVGRLKFLHPLYSELAKTEEGKEWAKEIYSRARPGYHGISSGSIDKILGWES